MTRGGKGERRLEFDLPAPLGVLGTLASALLPHISLLHGWLVLAQLSLPSSPGIDADADADADAEGDANGEGNANGEGKDAR